MLLLRVLVVVVAADWGSEENEGFRSNSLGGAEESERGAAGW